MMDPRIQQYTDAARRMKNGDFAVDVSLAPQDEITQLGQSLLELGKAFELKTKEINTLARLTEQANAGLRLEDTLNLIYDSFKEIIPFDRLSLSILENEGSLVKARWVRSELAAHVIQSGYSAPLEGSSLKEILSSGCPRIINDLEEYYQQNPQSVSTCRIIQEGMKSNLTCPLFAMGKPIGFMFFSSIHKESYKDVHVELFQQIAGQLALIVEKSRLYEDLVDLNELKSRFIGIAAHDIRNPISSIMSYLNLFENGYLGPLSEQQRGVMQRMLSNCQVMLSLLNDLLDLSSLQIGMLKVEFQKSHIETVIQSCVESFAPLASAKFIQLNVSIEENLPELEMDSNRIHQVLNNLISNAIKYSFPETEIHIQVSQIADKIQVCVKDQGQGIPEEDFPKLFQEFGKARVKPTGGETSTGLGLSIAQHIVQSHHGQITFNSTVGKGSEFYFSLPLEQPVKE